MKIFIARAIVVYSFLSCGLSYATYPKTFLWGAAYSAHQTEGIQGGGANSDWYAFEHAESSPIKNGDTADRAIDHWNRYSDDYEWAKNLGLTSLRTSLAWEKIEPMQGLFSQEVILHYRAQFELMRSHGIKPMIALHHFTHPKWFHEKGGWLNPESPKWFLEYAQFVVQNLGDLCDLWITFNEPMILVIMGYLKGEIPPAIKSLDSAYEAAFNIARAHRMTAYKIHELQGTSPKARGRDGKLRGVGLANSFQIYDAFNPRNIKDVRAADWVAKVNNWDFLKGIETGVMKFELLPEMTFGKNFERAFPKEDLPPWATGSFMDWMGVNYYTQYLIRYNPLNLLKVEWVTPEGTKGDNGNAIYPDGLERILRQTAEHFDLPLVVTENGLADAEDSRRSDFIKGHLHFLDHLIGSPLGSMPGLEVLGYYHWSLMDNFEWLQGYGHRFGLLEIKYDQDLKRVPRTSFWVYSHAIKERM